MKDDMDDIFRNAATNYPLNTDGATWDAVMQQLQQPGAITPMPAKGRNKNNFKGFLLLLLPLAFIYHLPRYEVVKDANNAIGRIEVSTPVVVNNQPSQNNLINTALVLPDTSYTNSIKKIDKPVSTQATAQHSSTYFFYKKNTDSTTKYTENAKKLTPDNIDNSYSNSVQENIGAVLSGTGGTRQVLGNETPVKKEEIKKEELPSDSVQVSITVLDSAAPVVAEQISNDKNNKKNPSEKGFYAGLVVSPDFSTVKMQQVQKLGYGAGILVGYRISKRWAIETGVLWEKKYYYSKGEYFNTGKLNLPSNTVINKVSGWCNMVDIPITARYFFSTGKKHSWSANAGLLSYIMNKENYTYQYTRYGNPYERGYEYKSDTRNWFSVMQLGLGYEHNAGRWGLIRLEPYIRVPLGGIGVGSLPVSSAGLNIGIMKPIR